MSHVTGGGFPDNLPRVLPEGLRAVVEPGGWEWPALFRFIREKGSVAGGGDAPRLQLRRRDGPLRRARQALTEVVRRSRTRARGPPGGTRRERPARRPLRVTAVDGAPYVAPVPWFPLPARLAVLLSGRGSNFEALADACERGELPARIVLVLSDRADAAGLGKARERGLQALVEERHAGEGRVRRTRNGSPRGSRTAGADLVCLAGFMRVLSACVRGALPAADRERPPLAPSGLSGPRRADARRSSTG